MLDVRHRTTQLPITSMTTLRPIQVCGGGRINVIVIADVTDRSKPHELGRSGLCFPEE